NSPSAYLIRAMRAERFGSYSIPITSAATPRLRRLKSTLRYFCLWPPPMCRDVSRPRLLRPPLLFFGAIRLLSGCHFVISSKAGSDLKRSVGVSGRNSFRAITFLSLDQVDLVAFFQRHDGFFPSRTAPKGSAHTSLLAGVITSVHVHDCLLKKPLNCVLDLNLVRLRTDAEDVLVQLLAHQCRLLSQRGGLNNLVRLVHFIAH